MQTEHVLDAFLLRYFQLTAKPSQSDLIGINKYRGGIKLITVLFSRINQSSMRDAATVIFKALDSH